MIAEIEIPIVLLQYALHLTAAGMLFVLTAVVLPWLRSLRRSDAWKRAIDIIDNAAYAAVRATEQEIGQGMRDSDEGGRGKLSPAQAEAAMFHAVNLLYKQIQGQVSKLVSETGTDHDTIEKVIKTRIEGALHDMKHGVSPAS